MITIRVAIAVALVLPAALAGQTQPRTYDQLLALFKEWRSFEEPPRLAGGVPDYTPATNARRLEGLRALQSRLAAIDRAGWTVPQQVDYHLVRAEMNGMDYHLRVLQPFARDPAYYASSSPRSPTRRRRKARSSTAPSSCTSIRSGRGRCSNSRRRSRRRRPPTWRRGCRRSRRCCRRRDPTLPARTRTTSGSAASARSRSRAKRWPRCARAWRFQRGPLGGDRRRSDGHRRFRGLAAGRSAEEDGPLGHRQGALHLVPAQRPAGAAVLGRRSGDHQARAGARRRVAASRGEPEPAPAAARSRRDARGLRRPCRSGRSRAT